MKLQSLSIIVAILVLGCASGTPDDDRQTDDIRIPAPPWEGSVLSPEQVPRVLINEWQNAGNRQTCAPIGFASVGDERDAVARRANFSGGWAIAWDLPNGPGTAPGGQFCSDCGRGAFGIAGTGVEPTPDTYDDWSQQVIYSDGSRIGYGPRDQQWLAYLEIAGQRCLYNVWSYRGREHLEMLINHIRMVR